MKKLSSQFLLANCYFLFLASFVGCGIPEESIGSDLQQFFRNSERRDPSQIEQDRTVRVGGCTGFFV